jgi:hypothetical protein
VIQGKRSWRYPIRELYRGRNDLTALVLTGNPRLEKLACNNNPLDILNLDDNTSLTDMISFGNRLQIIVRFYKILGTFTATLLIFKGTFSN